MFPQSLGTAFTALRTRLPWPKQPSRVISLPKVELRTERHDHEGFRVTDMMLSISGARPGKSGARFEGAAYFVWKRRKE
jgi:hypothetical protein